MWCNLTQDGAGSSNVMIRLEEHLELTERFGFHRFDTGSRTDCHVLRYFPLCMLGVVVVVQYLDWSDAELGMRSYGTEMSYKSS